MNNNRWIKMADLNVERSKPTSFIYQNELYVFGGMTMNPKINESFAEKYIEARNEW
jgi:N-acetylneuraminic acid mutarotase